MGPEIPGKPRPKVKGLCSSAPFGPLVRLNSLGPPASSQSSRSKLLGRSLPHLDTHPSPSCLDHVSRLSPFTGSACSLSHVFCSPLQSSCLCYLCLCPVEQDNHGAAHTLAPPSHILQLGPGWVPVPWSPHFVRSGLRITGATHWEAAGRPASLLLVQRFPDFALRGITRGALKTPAAQVTALVTESEHRSQASVVVIDPLLIPCATKFGQHLVFPSYSGQYLPLNLPGGTRAEKMSRRSFRHSVSACQAGWDRVGILCLLLTSPLLLLPN